MGIWKLLELDASDGGQDFSPLVLALAVGVNVGLAYGLASTIRRLASGLMKAAAVGAVVGSVLLSAVGLGAGPGIGLGLGGAGAALALWEAHQRGDGPVIVVAQAHWSSRAFARRWLNAMGVAAGLGLGAMTGGTFAAIVRGERSDALFFPLFGAAITLGLTPGLLVESGLEAQPTALAEGPYPVILRRQLLHIALRRCLIGLGVGVGLSLAGWWIFSDVGGLSAAIANSRAPRIGRLPTDVIGYGLGFSLAAVLSGSFTALLAVLSYGIVYRELEHSALIPRGGLLQFLAACADHRHPLLLSMGRGYRFLHPTFQAFLAEEWRNSGRLEARIREP